MVINRDRFVTSSMSVFFIEKHSAITVLNALERGGRYVVLGESGTAAPRPRDAVTSRAGLTNVRLHDLRPIKKGVESLRSRN